MFDNGNFRRKRKRRSDPTGSSGHVAGDKTDDANGGIIGPSDTVSVLGCTTPGLENSPGTASDSKPSPPPSVQSNSCFTNFGTHMSSMISGSNGMNRPVSSGGLMGDLSQGRQSLSRLNSYSPSQSSIHNTVDIHNRLNYYQSTVPNQQSGLSAPLCNFSVNNLIYSREGTEV